MIITLKINVIISNINIKLLYLLYIICLIYLIQMKP
jgi:hypothetical protein